VPPESRVATPLATPAFKTAAEPKPRFVRAVDALAKSDKLFARYA